MGNYYPSHNYGPEHAASLAAAQAPAKHRQPVSEARLAANRANALKSTGPRTPEGKAASSMNAFRHGITGQISALADEDRAAREAFTAPLIQDLKPEGAVERHIALSIAEGHWRLNRIRAIEDNIFALGHYGPAAEIDVENAELHGALTSARVFLESSRTFERLTLYEQRIQRGIEKHMRELETLRFERQSRREQSLEAAAALAQVAEFNGETAPDGFEFSKEEIAGRIKRKTTLKAAEFHERNHWNPEIEYPG